MIKRSIQSCGHLNWSGTTKSDIACESEPSELDKVFEKYLEISFLPIHSTNELGI